MNDEYFISEIHKILRLGPDLSKPFVPPVQEIESTQAVAIESGLPFELPLDNTKYEMQTLIDVQSQLKPANKPTTWASYLIYPVVFAIAFVFFYIALNFNALLIQAQGWFAKDEEEVILQDNLDEYNAWIKGYYFSVSDKSSLKPLNDLDKDGLTNMDEFLAKTNPTLADSDSDGVTDGKEFINETNPWGSGEMSQKQVAVAQKVDVIKVNNRISLNAAALNQTNTDYISQASNFDLTRPGRLTVPKLEMQVPLIWSQDPLEFDHDLTTGVVHYPGTALPGERGIVYISGHSSDYFWKDHPYKQIFAKINALEPGDDIFVDVYGKDGKTYTYRYKVTAENVYAPDDQRQFLDTSSAKLNLSTCWPIGTQKDRYVVTAELQKP